MEYTVEKESSLMEYLLSKNLKRNDIKNYLKYKNILVNKKAETRFNLPLNKGDVITILKGRSTSLPFEIIYEDDELIVINKPSGLLSDATSKEQFKTAYRLVSDYLSLKKEKTYLVHRLDQYTSGLLMFAKNKKLQMDLQESWNDLVKTRGYIAVCEGLPAKKESTIDTLLYESKSQVVKVSKSEGKRAITHYKVLKSNKNYALLEVRLDTGKKNQIRVHLSYIGNPIAGDEKYGAKTNPIKRLCLHADKLEFIHPHNKKVYSFKSSIPSSFNKLFS